MTPACRYTVAALLALTASCDPGGDGRTQDPPRLPMYFWLNADASTEEDGLTVECDIEYIVEVHGEVSRTDAVVEYVATYKCCMCCQTAFSLWRASLRPPTRSPARDSGWRWPSGMVVSTATA